MAPERRYTGEEESDPALESRVRLGKLTGYFVLLVTPSLSESEQEFLNDRAVYFDSRNTPYYQMYLYDKRQFGAGYDDHDANFIQLGQQLAEEIGDTAFTATIKELHVRQR